MDLFHPLIRAWFARTHGEPTEIQALAWGAAEVEAAGEPLEAKVRGHLKVRNRKDEPCSVCGTPIRRPAVPW